MKPINVLGLTIFSASALALIGFGLYEFLEVGLRDPSVPLIIKLGITGIILGVIIILISLIVERVKDYKEEK